MLPNVARYLNPPAIERPPGYSHVVDVSGSRLIFIAGQADVDAAGTVVGGGDVETQAEQAFRNLPAALGSVGCTASNLVRDMLAPRRECARPFDRRRFG